MKIVDNSATFELSILGYEYPYSPNKDDANWLMVGINITDQNELSWSAKDNCLRTFELIKLKDWLYSIQNDMSSNSTISFTENELAFRYESPGIFKVVLDFNFHPKGVNYNYDDDTEYVICFIVNEKHLISLRKSVNDYIMRFPEKILI